jgi:hypothetical protein
MNNPTIVDTLVTDVYELASVFIDETGNWLAYEDNYHLTIINVDNPNSSNVIAYPSEGIIKFSYIDIVNKLIARYDGELPNREKMVIIDPVTMEIIDTIQYDICSEILVDSDVNFSKSGDLMYILSGDSILQKPALITYSIPSKQIISNKYLEDLSLPGSEKDYFYNRQRDFAVIESYYSMNDPYNYYRIYFFHNDSLSIPISYLNPAEAYITNHGKNLVLLEAFLGNDSTLSKPTGKIEIYDMTDGEMKKTIQLPPDGKVMCFENFPNNVYYAIDIEKPTRQIYTLKMDSIFNVLNLTSLNPSSAIVNSQPFTLTVNGHGFDSLSTVHFNDTAKTTTFISDSILTAEISTSDIATVGNYPVWVTDQWAISDTLFFSVFTQPPVLSSISPGMTFRVPHSDIYFDFTVTVKGELFNDSSVVYFNGQQKTTSYVSDSLITFLVTNYEIVASGDIPVWVSNPGSNSDTLYFSVADTLPHSIIPTVLCVEERAGEFTAYLGYENNNDVSVFISVGVNNSLFSWVRPFPVIAINNQPTVFVPGVVVNAFNVVFNGNEFIWRLAGVDLSVDERADKCE